MERRRLAGMASRLQPIFCPRKILKTQKFCRVVASMNELACGIAVWFVAFFDCLASWRLVPRY